MAAPNQISLETAQLNLEISTCYAKFNKLREEENNRLGREISDLVNQQTKISNILQELRQLFDDCNICVAERFEFNKNLNDLNESHLVINEQMELLRLQNTHNIRRLAVLETSEINQINFNYSQQENLKRVSKREALLKSVSSLLKTTN